MAHPKLPLRLRLVEIDYVGAPVEFSPAVDYEAAWPGARFSRRLPPLPVGGVAQDFEVPLPAEGALGGDTLWLMLVAQTHVSAVSDIDVREAAFRQTDLETGTTHVSLHALLEASAPLRLPVVADLTFRCALQALSVGAPQGPPKPEHIKKALGAATKAVLSLEVRHDALSAESSVWLERHRSGRCRSPEGRIGPTFDTPAFYDAQAKLMNRWEEAYVLNATDLGLSDGRKGAFAATSDDPLMAKLHIAGYDARTGRLPPIAYLMQDVADRLGAAAAAAEMAGHAPDALASAYRQQLHMRLLSALAAVGLDADRFIAAISASRTTGPTTDYVTALSVLPQMASLAMTRVRYKADARVPNMRYVLMHWTAEEQRRLLPAEFFVGGKTPAPPPPMAGVPPVSMDAPTLAAPMARTVMGAYARGDQGDASRVLRAALGMRSLTRTRPRVPLPGAPRKRPAGSGVVVRLIRPQPVPVSTHTGDASRPSPGAGAIAMLGPYAHAFVSEDDWSSALLAMKLNADDCDGVGAGAVVMLERDRRVLQALPGLPPLLVALRTLHEQFMPAFIGGTVSEAYVEKDATPGAPPKHIAMPIRGSPEAALYGEGGHGYGVLLPVAAVCDAHLRAMDAFPATAVHADDRARIRAVLEKQTGAAPAWLRTHPALRMVLEGTGPVYPLLAPAEELLDDPVFARKVAARMTFARSVKFKGFGPTWDTPFDQRTARDAMTVLADLVRVEAQPYEARKRANPRQWITNFYRGVGGVFAPRFLDMGLPTLASASAIDMTTRTRGVDMATFMLRPQDVALHAHSGATISEAEWRRDFAPVIAAALEQHVTANYLREPSRLPRLDAQCLPVAASAVASLASGTTLDSSPATVAAAAGTTLDAIMAASARPDRAVLATTVDLEQLQQVGSARTGELVRALDDLKRDGHLVDYAFVHEHPLVQCPPCMQLLLLLPVGEKLDERLFPRNA